MQGQIKGLEDRITFEEIDISKNRDAAKQYGINLQGTPTLIVLDSNGKQVKVFVGTPSKTELDKAIKQAINP